MTERRFLSRMPSWCRRSADVPLGKAGAASLLTVQLLAASYATDARAVPAGFVDELVTGGISSPTALAFAPDGRLLVTEQTGAVRVVKEGALLSAPFARLTVDSRGERGLAEFQEVDYVVISAGSLDLLVEVVCADDDQLLDTVSRIRSVPGVESTETFLYLGLRKQTYAWGTRRVEPANGHHG